MGCDISTTIKDFILYRNIYFEFKSKQNLYSVQYNQNKQ